MLVAEAAELRLQYPGGCWPSWLSFWFSSEFDRVTGCLAWLVLFYFYGGVRGIGRQVALKELDVISGELPKNLSSIPVRCLSWVPA